MSASVDVQVGIIGGTGLENIEGLTIHREVSVITPFGNPSDDFRIGEIGGVDVAFLNRHGRGHHVAPHELPNLANVWALKKLGVERVVSVSAVGSLRREIEPGHLVIPDQLLDETSGRIDTFFGGGIVAHASLADPYCPDLRERLHEAAAQTDSIVHNGGTLVVMQGPQFSTRAASRRYRQWGADIVGMTALPEAALVREAQMCYATLALSTDYDSWHQDDEAVTMSMVGETMRQNGERAARVLGHLLPELGIAPPNCECSVSMEHALATDLSVVDPDVLDRLSLLLDHILPRPSES